MNRTRRYGRWLKRALIIYVAYLAIGVLLFGASPGDLTAHPGATFAQYRPILIQFLFLFFVLIIQFVGMFWFLSRGTYYTVYPNEYEHTFDDVRGQPAAVRSTKEVLRLFQGFKDFRQMGGYPPHGILFEGPPGTGKTLMAKAIAGHAQVPIMIADGGRFISTFIGIGNIKVRRMFSRARAMSDKYGGAVIFIDELDALGGSRGGVSQRFSPKEGDQATRGFIVGAGMGGGGMGVVNELLVGLDGFVQPKGIWRHFRRLFRLGKPRIPQYNILIIGATNRAAALDEALLRPGRFDRKIHVGLPDAEGRQDIARYYLAKVRHEPIDTMKLARMSKGYSPAMIKNVINEALIFALQDGRDALRWDDLWNAKLVEEIGLKQPVNYTPHEKETVATHEAAHAVASYALERGELQIQVITIQKRVSGALGLVHYQEVEDKELSTQREYIARIQTSLAGMVAEQIAYGQSSDGATGDLANATRTAAEYVGIRGMGKSLVSVAAQRPTDDTPTIINMVLNDRDLRLEVDQILHDCRNQVEGLLRSKWAVVEGVRDALLEREELIGDEIEELMAQLGEREPLPVRAPSQEGVTPGAPPAGNGPSEGNGPPGQGQVPGGFPPPPPGTPPPPHRGPGGNGPRGGNGPPPPPPGAPPPGGEPPQG
jgi:cell division protease FtsH